jgi:hypothetical protein
MGYQNNERPEENHFLIADINFDLTDLRQDLCSLESHLTPEGKEILRECFKNISFIKDSIWKLDRSLFPPTRDDETLSCNHQGEQCSCVCHEQNNLIIHDHACCSPCLACGFRDACKCNSCSPKVPSNICPGCCYSDGRENREDGTWTCWRCGDEGEWEP